MNKEPKFKIGDTVEASWAGDHTSIHIITGMEKNHHGFWYTWEGGNYGSGLYEKHLRKIKKVAQ